MLNLQVLTNLLNIVQEEESEALMEETGFDRSPPTSNGIHRKVSFRCVNVIQSRKIVKNTLSDVF